MRASAGSSSSPELAKIREKIALVFYCLECRGISVQNTDAPGRKSPCQFVHRCEYLVYAGKTFCQ